MNGLLLPDPQIIACRLTNVNLLSFWEEKFNSDLTPEVVMAIPDLAAVRRRG